MARLLLVLLVLPGFQAFAENETLPALHNFHRSSFETIRKTYQLAVLFSPDCLPCHKMVRDLGCLETQTKIVLLGVGESESKLRKTYLGYQTQYPAYMVSSSQFTAIGGKTSATPQLWFMQSGGVKVGKLSCHALKAMLDRQSKSSF